MQTHQSHTSGSSNSSSAGPQHAERQGHYGRLMLELCIDFVIMYLVMYTMIRTLDHFYLNINNVWMTLMMVTPMALVMLFAMRSMFPSRSRNLALIVGAVVVFGIGYYGMRAQVGVGDEQFLRSMIPHHSGAILMCEEAKLTDPELKQLCVEIIDAQRREIAQMQAMLARQ
jgi:hypothetical protein